MNKTSYIISMIILLAGFAVMLYILYLMVYPFKTIEMKQPFKVLTPVVKAGEDFKILNEYCKYTNSTGTLSRSFIDGEIYPISTTVSNLQTGCGSLVITIQVPEYLPSGIYHLQTTAEYKINPVRTIFVTSKSEDFQVIGAK